MLLQKGQREDAIHALINLWLKDERKSCMYCSRYESDLDKYHDCQTCQGKPLLATNKEILKVFSAEMQQIRQTRMNKHGSTKDKSIRWGVSIPADLYRFLDSSFERMYGEHVITKEYDLNWFMKKFGKYFQIPEER